MREIRVHRHQRRVALAHRIEKRVLVRAADAELARTLHADELRILEPLGFQHRPCPVRGIVIDDEDIGVGNRADDFVQQRSDVFALVVACREDEGLIVQDSIPVGMKCCRRGNLTGRASSGRHGALSPSNGRRPGKRPVWLPKLIRPIIRPRSGEFSRRRYSRQRTLRVPHFARSPIDQRPAGAPAAQCRMRGFLVRSLSGSSTHATGHIHMSNDTFDSVKLFAHANRESSNA